MAHFMYKLGDTYIGEYGIYCTAPVKQVNPSRWAVISFSITCYMGERETLTRMVNMGCCKEKELIARVEREIKLIKRYAMEEEDLRIDSIAYYHQYKGREAQMVLVEA